MGGGQRGTGRMLSRGEGDAGEGGGNRAEWSSNLSNRAGFSSAQ